MSRYCTGDWSEANLFELVVYLARSKHANIPAGGWRKGAVLASCLQYTLALEESHGGYGTAK